MKKLGILLFGALTYIFFLATFVYCAGFILGVAVPKNIDTLGATEPSFLTALAVNAALLSLFAVQHTIMARHAFKRRWTKIIHPAIERSTFVLITCLILCLIFFAWQPMPTVLWDVTDPIARGLLLGIGAIGFLGVVFTTFLIDHFDLFGLAQVWRNYRGLPAVQHRFQVRSLYRYSRHPLYLCFFIGFSFAPTMTLGHALFAVLCAAYVLLVGVRFEERGLIETHGDQYLQYRKDLPMIVPALGRSIAPSTPPSKQSLTA